jgi:hypothetical protein
MTNKPLAVPGYTDQSDRNISVVTFNKELEERVLRQIDYVGSHEDYDLRMVALARTKTQEAFMWLNRAVFQPQRISLPEDSE